MKVALISTAILACTLTSLQGQLIFDTNVTPDVIFGDGNANGSWTVSQSSGIELGLRAKVRFDENGQPQNIFNSNSDGTYDFAPGSYTASTRPDWNFEWAINSNFDGNGDNLTAFTYTLSLDWDSGAGTLFSTNFDPVNQPYTDNAIGDNSTGNGDGTSVPLADDATAPEQIAASIAYTGLIQSNNVAQNSWAYNWFAPIDPLAPGQYTIKLDAYSTIQPDIDSGQSLWIGGTEITVNVVPEPSTIGILSLAGLGILLIVRKRIKKTA